MTSLQPSPATVGPVVDQALGLSFADLLPDPVFVLGRDGCGSWRIRHANPAAEDVTGWALDEVVDQEPLHLIGPLTDPDLVASSFADLDRDGFVRRRIVLHRRDGSPLWCELRGGMLGTGPEGLAWAHILVEETAEGGRYRRLLENISDTVAVLDAAGTIRYISPSVQFLGSVQPSDYLHTNFLSLVEPEFAWANRGLWEQMLDVPGVHGPIRLTLHGLDGVTAEVEVVLNNRLDDPEVHGVVVTARNVADSLAARQVAAQMDRRLQALVQYASDIVVVLDDTGRVTYASPSVERIFGVRTDPSGDNGRFFELFHPDDVPQLLGEIALRLEHAGHTGFIESRLRAVAGEWTWFELAVTNLLDDPDVQGYVVNGRDVTERKQAEALLAGELSVLETMASSHTLAPVLRRLAEVAESFVPEAACTIGVLDDDGVIRHPAAPTLAPSIVAALDDGEPDDELGRLLRTADRVVCPDVGADPTWARLAPAVTAEGFRSCWWVPVRDGASEQVLGVVALFHPVGREPHPSEQPLLDRVRHLAALALERGRFERQLEHQAVHDSLTGIPNRTLLLDRVARALELGRRRATHTAVLFIDVDRFKVVNDSLGHAAGDELLRQLAGRLSAQVQPGDTVGRFGGDEFVVVVEDVGGEAGALDAAKRLLATIEGGLEVGGQPVRVSASIGVAIAGPGTDDVGPDAMIRNADAAMYRAKEAGRARVWLFEETLHEEAVRRYELEQGLRAALDSGELTLVYQPFVRLADGRVLGVEALLRWDRPGMERVGATELIPIAEDTGLIVAIGAWVLTQACRQAVAWDDSHSTAGLRMSVNLSARQLGDPALFDVVVAALESSGLPPERLCLEVTESALAGDPVAAARVLDELKGLGVRVAIDDFGTGYATLDYVRRFSMADELKIDRSFVSGIADLHSPDAAIVSAALVLADALGFEVVAEGVENADQLAVLRRLGCRAAQGFYFGRPVPAHLIE
jgi:diguanylate cyclase (GGDEF)-like protein/PAS domain S-box-containing protein